MALERVRKDMLMNFFSQERELSVKLRETADANKRLIEDIKNFVNLYYPTPIRGSDEHSSKKSSKQLTLKGDLLESPLVGSVSYFPLIEILEVGN